MSSYRCTAGTCLSLDNPVAVFIELYWDHWDFHPLSILRPIYQRNTGMRSLSATTANGRAFMLAFGNIAAIACTALPSGDETP